MTQAGQLSIVRALYDAAGRGDFGAAETLLTSDFFITEASGLPFAGRYEGRQALRQLYGKVMGLMDVASLEIAQHLAGGEYVAAIVTFRFQDPALAPAELLELYRFRDGKVCEIKPYYFDPAPVIAACAAKQRKTEGASSHG